MLEELQYLAIDSFTGSSTGFDSLRAYVVRADQVSLCGCEQGGVHLELYADRSQSGIDDDSLRL